MNFFKSILHNIGVVIVGLVLAFLCARLDVLLGIKDFHTFYARAGGWFLLVIGFCLRVWAAFYFYKLQMKVIVLEPQKTLITWGPFAFTRNPLYLGGNVFIFFGAALLLGSPSALVIITLHLPLLDLMIRREEKQLEQKFDSVWVEYKNKVRRWI